MTSKSVRLPIPTFHSCTDELGHPLRHPPHMLQLWPRYRKSPHLDTQYLLTNQMDTSYFIKSFSATPRAVVPGYAIGGILYFAIPWGLGTVMSSLAIGLESHPSFPTYPRRMTSSEVSGGLVLPYAAIAIAGKGGATAVLLMTFMAVTSTLSAQVIAVSSILSFDVYRLYFKKGASDRDIIRASHLGVIFFAAFAAGFSTMLHYVGIDLGWTLYMLGTSSLLPTLILINHDTH